MHKPDASESLPVELVDEGLRALCEHGTVMLGIAPGVLDDYMAGAGVQRVSEKRTAEIDRILAEAQATLLGIRAANELAVPAVRKAAEAGMSVRGISRFSGLHRNTVTRILNGARSEG